MERYPANGSKRNILAFFGEVKDPDRMLRWTGGGPGPRRRRRKCPPIPLMAPAAAVQGLGSHPRQMRSPFLRRRHSTSAAGAKPEAEIRASERQPDGAVSGGAAQVLPAQPETAPVPAGVASVPADVGSARRVVSLKNERQCLRCRRWFWAWDTERTVCYFCEP